MNIDGFCLCPFVPAGCPGMKIWHGQSGHMPVIFFRAIGKAGIGKIAGRQAKPGTGTPIPHH